MKPSILAAVAAANTACLTGLVMLQSPSHAGRGLDISAEQVNVYAIQSMEPQGLKLAQGWIGYNDGDTLHGIFRIYCPTGMIRPTHYIHRDRQGVIKKQGEWWETAFQAQWKTEKMLVNYTCENADFGQIQPN